MKIDKKLIKELVDHLSEFGLTEIEYQDGDKKIKVSKAAKSNIDLGKSGAIVSPTKSVLTDLILAPCNNENAVFLINSNGKFDRVLSLTASSITPSPKPSTNNAPASVPARNINSSLFDGVNGNDSMTGRSESILCNI